MKHFSILSMLLIGIVFAISACTENLTDVGGDELDAVSKKDQEHKLWICHNDYEYDSATDALTEKYFLIHVSDKAFDGNGNNDHSKHHEPFVDEDGSPAEPVDPADDFACTSVLDETECTEGDFDGELTPIDGLCERDNDGDGLWDSEDACPYDADNDVDGDGVCGDVDNCPDIANPGQEDTDGNGVGDACEPV